MDTTEQLDEMGHNHKAVFDALAVVLSERDSVKLEQAAKIVSRADSQLVALLLFVAGRSSIRQVEELAGQGWEERLIEAVGDDPVVEAGLNALLYDETGTRGTKEVLESVVRVLPLLCGVLAELQRRDVGIVAHEIVWGVRA